MALRLLRGDRVAGVPGARLKLNRATELRRALDDEIHAYLQRESYDLDLKNPALGPNYRCAGVVPV